MPNTSSGGDIWASGIVTNYEAACLPENARGCTGEVICQLCKKAPESVAQVLAGNKYMTRDNAALKILFFEILQDLGLVDSVPPWYSPLKPKPVYEANNAQEFWDVLLFAEHQEVRAYRLSGCSHYQPRVKGSHNVWDVLPMGHKPWEKEGRENYEIRTAPLGIKAEVPRIWSETI